MKLYEEILLLQGYFKGNWVVENVISWYDPLIKPYKVADHYYWSNFIIPNFTAESRCHYGSIEELEKRKGFKISDIKVKADKILMLRNCVEPEVAQYIWSCCYKDKQKALF